MERGLNNSYPESFRQQVLEDYFSSNGTIKACAAKWGIPKGSLGTWLKTCKNAEKSVSLRRKSIHMDVKDQALENLRLENERLLREVEYHKLRAAGYERLLEIVKHEDGIDLLKKRWCQTVERLSAEFPYETMETLCGLFGKSKQAYYKHKRKSFSELEVEKEILSLVRYYRSEMPMIGGLKLYCLVRSVLGGTLGMGRDKFLGLLHQHKLIIPPRKSHHTTNSNHVYFKYPDLVKELVIGNVNQVWVSDITYIYTTDDKFCYLHLVTDAFSRMIIGYVLSPTMEAKHTLSALNQAIVHAGGGNLCGTIHHSDRGVQYCCDGHITQLKEHHIRISMTEDSNPTDNAVAERVNGIIKNEFLDPLPTPRNWQEAIPLVDHAVHTYNTLRPHLSLGMKTPAQLYYRKQ